MERIEDMNKNGFDKLFWGFLFMLDFRIQGFDILPDVIGYIFFAVGFQILAVNSGHFKKAGSFNVILIVISIFQIYESPVQGNGFHINPFGAIVGIASLILGLVVVYHMFMGIKDMATHQEKTEIFELAGKRWTQYMILQIAALFSFVMIFVPVLAVVYMITLFVLSIVLIILIMKFMKQCGEQL